MAKARRRNVQCDLFLADVEALTLRDVGGEGTQAELQVRTAYGMFTIRFISKRHDTLRFTDLRARDRKVRKQATLISVPFAELVAGGRG